MAIIPGAKQPSFSFSNAGLQRQKKLIYLLVLVILITLGIYFFYINKPSFLASPTDNSVIDPNQAANLKLIDALNKASLDIPLLKDEKFQRLILPGANPVVVGQKGRPNPFVPF